MKVKLLVAAAIGTAALLGTVGCTSASSTTEKPAVQELNASWAESYTSVGQMSAHADAVVVGSVAKQLQTTVKDGIAYTDFYFHVDSWIKGTAQQADVQIHQTGGVADGVPQEVSGDPLLQVGQHSVLYLRQYEAGKYYIMGGPTGRFLVQDGKVSALPEGIARDGLPASVTQFTSRVQSLVQNPAE
jgi:hypothetical protein